jgi:hypothetical protein
MTEYAMSIFSFPMFHQNLHFHILWRKPFMVYAQQDTLQFTFLALSNMKLFSQDHQMDQAVLGVLLKRRSLVEKVTQGLFPQGVLVTTFLAALFDSLQKNSSHNGIIIITAKEAAE